MPRSLVFGNGRLLVQIDAAYVIRDLFWPHVGLYNHLNAFPIRFGVWADGRLAWSDDPGWSRNLGYEPGAASGASILRHEELGLELHIREGVLTTDDVFLRQIRIVNLRSDARTIRLFYNHDLRINESDIGDTALWQPYLEGMVHFKHRTYLLFGGRTDLGGVDEYTTGYKAFNGHEGTWRDAEDGVLNSKPIEQGSVDSTIRFSAFLPGNGVTTAYYWIAAGDSFEDLEAEWLGIRVGDPEHLLDQLARTSHDWARRWQFGNPAEPEAPILADSERDWLSPRVRELVTRSLHVIDAETDHAGAILAATDSDILETNRATYCYMWPRDGALVAMATDMAGYPQFARRHLGFCRALLTPRQPYFLHKYCPDGSFGATWHPWVWQGEPEIPFQEDETALTVIGLCRHLRQYHEQGLSDIFWSDFARPALEFMTHYVHPDTGLPRPSWDLWEERRGVHAYTVATVVAALHEGAQLANSLHAGEDAERYEQAAERMVEGLRRHMVHPESGALARCLVETESGYDMDATMDSAVLSAGIFGVLPWDDPIMVATCRELAARVQIQGGIGGFGRYENDYYFRRVDHQPGNPWVICTMWWAQAHIHMAKTPAELWDAAQWLEWACDRASDTQHLSEQYHPETGEALSVSPLTWSHAEVVRTAMMALAKRRELLANAPAR